MEYTPDVVRDKTILKIFILTNDKTGDRKIDMDDLEWRCLTDDGDFRSAEITKLRDADEKNQSSGKSNCPLYAVGHDVNKSKIWKLNEMDADRVAAWSKGGATDIKNYQML